jgi:hypothetical protein
MNIPYAKVLPVRRVALQYIARFIYSIVADDVEVSADLCTAEMSSFEQNLNGC